MVDINKIRIRVKINEKFCIQSVNICCIENTDSIQKIKPSEIDTVSPSDRPLGPYSEEPNNVSVMRLQYLYMMN